MKVEIIRELMRPFVTVIFVLLVVYLTLTGKIDAKEILSIAGILIAFWFGERSALKKPGE